LNFELPPNYFAAMDYHLDWIYAALFIYFHSDKYPAQVFPNKDHMISANQEVADLIIVFELKTKLI